MNPSPPSPCPRCGRPAAVAFDATGVCARCAGARIFSLALVDQPGSTPPMPTTGNSAERRRIGPYAIVGELGRGGMGVVYLAQHAQLGRIVAVKVLADGGGAAPELELRFLREAQTVARLNHPGIVAVHDAGREDGRAYFAMDYFEEGDLARRLRARAFAPREVADFMRKVAEAIAHSHAAGVLHRDLKPSNILLSGDTPHVADFGLAAELDSSGGLTARTAVLGTPHYLAPEALSRGSAAQGVPSDIYSLGIILHEMLTGRTPFAGASPAELPGLLARGEAPDLRVLAPHVPRDLATVCAKCLEFHPARRYATAAALAEDLRRFLAGEPIAARPVSSAGQLLRWTRRRPALAATWILSILLAAGSLTAALLINRERLRADAEAAHAATALRHTTAVLDFLKDDLLSQASLAQGTDPEVKLRTVLDRAAGILDRRFPDQPDVELALRDALGTTYLGVGAYQLTYDQLTRALALARARRGPEDAVTLGIEDRLGSALTGLRRNAESEAIKRRLLAIQLRRLGPDDRVTLNLQDGLATVLVYSGKEAEAEPLFRATAERQARVLGADDPTTLNTLGGLGVALTRLGRMPEAKAVATDVLTRARAKLGPDASITLNAMTSLASIHGRLGELAPAIALLADGIPRSKTTRGADHPDTLNMMNSLSVWYLRQRRLPEASALLDEVLAARLRTLGSDHAQTISTQSSIAGLYREQGRYDDAVRLLEKVIGKRTQLMGAEHPDTLRAVNLMGSCYLEQDRRAEAIAVFTRVLAARRTALGDTHPETLDTSRLLAIGLLRTGDLAGAERVLRAAIPWHDRGQPGTWQTAFVRCQLGSALARLGHLDEAGPLLREGYDGLEREEARIPPVDRKRIFAEAAGYFADYHTAAGRFVEADEWRAKITAP
ncbi:MAG: tetratricopeptide repeat protein [Undibacterium sp.]|nr:tetratricopeptide repeat protein [Opitutaceae bacterium]